MKNVVLAVSCLLCGVLVGVVLSATLFFGGFKFPGTQHAQAVNQTDRQASSYPSRSNSKKIESNPAQNTGELSVLAEQTAVPADSALSDSLQLDNLKAVIPQQSSIAEQQQILSLIASASLDELKDSIANISDDNNRMNEYQWIIGLITQRRIELDPVGTLQEISQFLSPQDSRPKLPNNMSYFQLLETYAHMRPQSLIEWLGNLPDDGTRIHLPMRMYSALAQSAPESAMDMLVQSTSLVSHRFDGSEAILGFWSEADPLAALQWLELNGDQQLLDQHAESIISQLASRDTEAARTAAARFPGLFSEEFPGLFSEDILVIKEIQTLAETDPVAAIEMAKSVPDSDELNDAMRSIVIDWSSRDPIAAFEHIESIVNTDKREMYTQGVGINKPLAAIEWLNAQGDWLDNPYLVQQIARFLPEHDLGKAMAIYPSVNQQTQLSMSQEIVRQLYQDNPQSARSWYEGLSDNDAKWSSLIGLVSETVVGDPLQALDLLNSAINSDNAEMILGEIHVLSLQYPEEVESWLVTANIDEQRKTEFRTFIAGNRGENINGFVIDDH